MVKNLSELTQLAGDGNPKTIAVVCAEDQDIMDVITETRKTNIAQFVLVGERAKIAGLMAKNNLGPACAEVIDEKDHKAAAAAAVNLVKSGRCDLLMKGNLHTSIYFKAILNKETGLAKGNLLSQCSVYEKLYGEGLQLLTDCAMAIAPTLEEKVAIIENAVELARKLGYEKPRVAMLSATEVVNPKIPDTMEAAILSKMAERGQIKNCIVDGPFALDNVLSEKAAAHKGIVSPVAGNADIIVVPNLQVGNVLHKAIAYFGKKETPAAVMGASTPVIATSRTDSVESKILTVSLAMYLAR